MSRKGGSNRYLFLIAGMLGMASSGIALLFNKKNNMVINESQAVQEAIQEVKSNKAVVDILGGEYRVGKVELSDSWSQVLNKDIRVILPIMGIKRNANLIVFGERQPDTSIRLKKAEMVFDHIDGKKLLLLEREPVKSENIEPKRSPQLDAELRFVKVPK